MISVICPTIDGRSESLARCEDSYSETTDDFEFIVVRNMPTCNEAWNVGISTCEGDLIHLTADDIEASEGWWQVGKHWIEAGFLPAPRILNPDGSLQSCGDGDWEQETGSLTSLTRIPFFSRAQMETAGFYPFPAWHYMGDQWCSHKARLAGIETVVVREMLFVHSYASVGRLDHRLPQDVASYFAAGGV